MDQPLKGISVTSLGFFAISDLAPLADEMTGHYGRVRVSAANSRPPAAAWGDIPLYIDLGEVAKTAAELFLAGWLARDAEELRSKLRELLRSARDRFGRSGPGNVLLSVRIGRVRFYFHEPLSDEEFSRRIEAARQYVQTLPDEAFSGEAGPGEYAHIWDKRSQSWKGQIYQVTEGEFVHILQYTLE